MRFPVISSATKLLNWLPKIKELSSHGKWEEIFTHYRELAKSGVGIQLTTDPSFFHLILKSCLNLSVFRHGNSIHAYLIKQGMFESNTSIQNSLMDFYVKSGNVESAFTVFHETRARDSVSWNIIIHGSLNQAGYLENGLFLFNKASRTGMFEPNIATLVLLIQACQAVNDGFQIQGYVIKTGLCTISSVQNSLLSFYVQVIGIGVARRMFDEMVDRDVVSWSVMIGGYAHNGEAHMSLGLFREMVSVIGHEVDGHIIVSALQACTSLENIGVGRMAHAFAICRGLDYDLFVGNSLIDMYSKCSDADAALKVFREMPQKNLVSWNSILSGLVHNEKHAEAIYLLDLMPNAGIKADEVTMVNILQLCKGLLDPVCCKSIHCAVLRRGYELNKVVINSLIDVYAKCNLIRFAWILFSQMIDRDTITWSTMIAGFTHCGMPEEAIALFTEMNFVQVNPNAITLLSLLDACSSLGELERSKWAHGIAIRRGLVSEVAVGTGILDMYSKCGAIETSRMVFNKISQKNIVSWSAMIAAYGMNGFAHDALALFAEMKLQGLKPNAVTTLSALSACSHGGLVEEGISLFRELIQDHGIKLRLEHYSCMVDLLGRAGKLDWAVDLMQTMPEELRPGASAWGAILSACRKYRNNELGEQAVSQVLELEPSKSAGYILASSIYATECSWSDAARMRLLAKERGVKVVTGYSLVHVDSRASKFVAGDRHHPLSDKIYFVVERLHKYMQHDNRKNKVFINS